MTMTQKLFLVRPSNDLLQARWRWPGLMICHVLTLMILLGWLWAPSRQWLDALDMQVFHLLNAPLATSTLWAKIWAVGNMRLTDLAAGCIMLGFIIKGGWIFTGTQVRRALYAFLPVLALLLLIRVGPFAELVKLMHWQHSGPSLVVAGAVRLGELFPAWDAVWHIKDSSVRSFPGDHASVLLLWVLFLWPYATGRQRLLISGLSRAVPAASAGLRRTLEFGYSDRWHRCQPAGFWLGILHTVCRKSCRPAGATERSCVEVPRATAWLAADQSDFRTLVASPP